MSRTRSKYINFESGVHSSDDALDSSEDEDEENDEYDETSSFIDNSPQDQGHDQEIDFEEINVPPPKKSRLTKKVVNINDEKLPGDETFPVNAFSLTISKCKGKSIRISLNCHLSSLMSAMLFSSCLIGDVPLPLLEVVYNWIVAHCVKGGIATEVGKRAFNFHLQGLLQLRYPKTKPYVTKLSKILKSLIPKQQGYKIMLKPLQGAQTLSAMIGVYLLLIFLYNLTSYL